MASLAVDTGILVAAGACIVAGVALILLIVAPWKSVREEPPLDDDIETRLLLGENPETIAAEADAAASGSDSAHGLATHGSDDE